MSPCSTLEPQALLRGLAIPGHGAQSKSFVLGANSRNAEASFKFRGVQEDGVLNNQRRALGEYAISIEYWMIMVVVRRVVVMRP